MAKTCAGRWTWRWRTWKIADYPFMAAKALARLGTIYLDDGQYGDALRMFQLATVPTREAESTRI